MNTEENKKNRIIEYASKNFMTIGYSRVTMEDIARGVGMGKATVYKLFPSKEMLLLSSIDYFAANIEKTISDILLNENVTPVEKLSLFLKTVAEKLSFLNPELLKYLERSVPEAYEKIERTRQRIIMTNFVKLLEDGKKGGVFDPQMDVKLVTHILIGAIQHITQAQVLATLDYNFEQLFKAIISAILKGCLTEEGRKKAL